MSHHLISPTALLVACMRERTDIPYCAEIAQRCEADVTARELLGDDLETFIEFRGPYTELRFKALTAAMERYHPEAVLELASGLSPRGLASDRPYLETDLPDMIAEKEALAKEIRPRQEHRFRAVDVLDVQQLKAAAAELPGRLAVLHEGLMLYFPQPERDRLAENMAAILRGREGAWITTDVYLRSRYAPVLESHQKVRGAIESLNRVTGRSLAENVFAHEDEALEFFGRHGFQVTRLRQRELVPRLVLEPPDAAVAASLDAEEVWMMTLA